MKTRDKAATIPIFPRTKMGMIFFLYTYSSYPSYLSHTINTNKPYSPAPLLPAFPYIPCQPIYLLSVFSQRFTPPSFSYPVFARSIRFRPSRSVSHHAPVAGISLLSVSRLVGRVVMRVVSCRFCSSSCHIGSSGGAPFLSARFLVSSRPLSSSVPFVVSWGRCVSTGRSVCRLACRPVVAFRVSCVSSSVSCGVLCGISSSHRIRLCHPSSLIGRGRSVSSCRRY